MPGQNKGANETLEKLIQEEGLGVAHFTIKQGGKETTMEALAMKGKGSLKDPLLLKDDVTFHLYKTEGEVRYTLTL